LLLRASGHLAVVKWVVKHPKLAGGFTFAQSIIERARAKNQEHVVNFIEACRA
jgi:hypothetical protein